MRSVVCCLDTLKEEKEGDYARAGKIQVLELYSRLTSHLFILLPAYIYTSIPPCIGIHSMTLTGFHDGSKGTLDPFVDTAADFIHACMNEREERLPVLVHCSVGKTRATSVCAVYLMKYEGMDLWQAMTLLRSKRHRCYPLLHFWCMLMEKERVISSSSSSSSLDRDAVIALHTETINAREATEGKLSTKVSQLTAMGFLEADALACLHRHNEDVQASLNELLGL